MMNITETPSQTGQKQWDPGYELKAVSLLATGFGIVALDRFIINPLFPVMKEDLGLSYQDLGLISAVLALTWGISCIFSGRLSDIFGRKKILIPSAFIFSILVATTGLAGGVASLIIIRALMGLAEGAFVPASIVATIDASKPKRIGLNVGIQQMASPLLGLTLGPIIAIALLDVLPSWHWVFAVAAVPGLIVAVLMMRVLRDDKPATQQIDVDTQDKVQPGLLAVLSDRNVLAATLGMSTCLTALITTATFMPNYLTDHIGLSVSQMGFVMVGLGAGSCIGQLVVPAISDFAGRKLTIVISQCLGVVLLFCVNGVTDPAVLFALLFGATLFIAGVVAITVGPLIHGVVSPAVATTATGLVVGVGEILGGAVAPALTGGIADEQGIQVIVNIALGALLVSVLIYLFGIKEKR